MRLCNFCVKTGILCQKCQEKVNKGDVSETELHVAKILLKLEEKYPSLQNLFFYNAYEIDNVLAISVGSGDIPRMLALKGQILKDLSKSVGKRVRVFEKSGDLRKFLEHLFMPTKILAINTIWIPDGSTETRVILPRYSRRLSMSRRVLKEIAEKIRGISLRVTFEDQRDRY